MVFYGEFAVSITEGGRIALPKKIRELLTNNMFVVTKGFGTCLAGYDKSDWEQRANSLLDVSLLDKENIGKRRSLFSSTVYIELDEQGRAVLPKGLLQFADLENKAIIVGVGDHFELWNSKKWNEYISANETL
ncbi:MAG: division/cell wall cluster transcriptional repressor MraZ [Candidatus Roizmanbacteria bacterium]|uniref:Transcriptional regulator MraZ n=2 Tax=Candidatus Roizmaniibacteriota TaxID=1752723 RepID=A0A2M8EXN8_9BACT|nr:division/cell wall cluster transcriptional repressor MraZ [Candidatus Roizmanbacteria bacterium]PIZ64494.1 MAG: division/cell wall cluster transcriptional repressor MraZ [Candidatus Roizmanbacteria bacterium CG_4_10_14_0_2_um_filter_39_12]PJC30823.1 MAG: division/cell wall cluster transcriptional repressor MraZ [Candidatus Roizmanbacteria bacterium CG_4_9_14_0_2_um_filter_39_13]PJE62256.1 MAG: division/cell wall cluster transcriptional repressor MraZ [Candidatus Roizmanbacteria bacterium CG10